jgi:iron complex transport system ATP-binding protein
MRLEAEGLHIPRRLERTRLAVEAPQFLCLVGPNGSGKTSLLHALAGIGRPAGEVRIDGAPLSALPALRRREIAYLPASHDVAWPLLGRDLVALSGVSPGEAEAALESLGAAELGGRRMDRLSTGERSRVLIARALAARPSMLLLDEPAANLDPAWQIRLMTLLARLARDENRIVIAAMHDLDLAASYADRLLIMNEGRIAADGDPAALLQGPEIPAVFGIERAGSTWRLVGEQRVQS